MGIAEDKVVLPAKYYIQPSLSTMLYILNHGPLLVDHYVIRGGSCYAINHVIGWKKYITEGSLPVINN